MILRELLNKLVEVGIYGGIATENPSEDNLHKFGIQLVQLKRGCGCHIEDFEEFKKKMPFYYQVEETMPMEHAETGRLALKEVAPCCLLAVFESLLEQEE